MHIADFVTRDPNMKSVQIFLDFIFLIGFTFPPKVRSFLSLFLNSTLVHGTYLVHGTLFITSAK